MKKDEEQDDHSVKVIQCKRKPCLSIGKGPNEAEELIRGEVFHDDANPSQPSLATKGTRW